jgi:glycine betaine/proline transport system substrate-binding protein
MQKKNIIKTLCIAIFAAVFFVSPVSAEKAMPGEGVTVKPARATWTTGYFLEALYSRALEELGYDVEKSKDLSNPMFYQAVTHGDVDFWANGWFPIHYAQLPKDFDEHAKIVGTIVKAGGLQGYLVSKAEVEKFGIKSLDDFKRPEVKEAFDENGDGKAELVACPPGWGCEKVISHHMDVYDLHDHITPIKAGYTAGMAEAVGRQAGGKPVFFYTWTPNWTIFRFKPGKDVMWINVPEIIPSDAQKDLDEDILVGSGVEGAVSDPIKLGFAKNDIAVVANKDFLKKNPVVEKLFTVMSVPLEDIAAQNYRMYQGEDSAKDIQRHVDEWIAENKADWDGWMATARKMAE